MAMAPKKKEAVEAEAQNETEAGEGEGPAEASPKKKFSLKLIIIAATGLLVLCGGGVGAYFFMSAKQPAAASRAPVAKPAGLSRSARHAGQPVQCRRRPPAISEGQDRARIAGPD